MKKTLKRIGFGIACLILLVGCADNKKLQSQIDPSGTNGRLALVNGQANLPSSWGWMGIVRDKATGTEYLLWSEGGQHVMCPMTSPAPR